jgi:hypothetical protein
VIAAARLGQSMASLAIAHIWVGSMCRASR